MTKREYLYTVLMEEAAEVSQAASKIMRFGEQAYNPADKEMKDNLAILYEEWSHLTAAIEMLIDEGIIPNIDITEYYSNIKRKKQKVIYYMNEYLKQQEK